VGTLFYDDGPFVHSFNLCTNTELADSPLLPYYTYGLQLLPSGGMLVAEGVVVVRLDPSGNQIQTYTLPQVSFLWAIALDPDGTSFWTGDLSTGEVFKVDIATGNILAPPLTPIATT
jgi:hypothetical protein